jgi:fibronectin-binding autotransporter adhesin
LSGVGAGSGALCSQGSNRWTGGITLAGDSQISVDGDSLYLGGVVSGSYGLTKVGSGKLTLANAGNTFSGALSVLEGTLSAPTFGALGQNAAPVLLGSDSKAATFLYSTTFSASTSYGFGLAAGGTGEFSISGSLTLTRPIGGAGTLVKSDIGALTLSGSNSYTGATTVTAGTLAINTTGSIKATSGIVVGQGALLQLAGGTGTDQLPDAGNLTLSGGSLSFTGTGVVSESTGALILNAGQNTITVSNGGGISYLRFASGPANPATGATVNFCPVGVNTQIQFAANPGSTGNILGGYAFFGGADFATTPTAAPYTVQAYSAYTGGNLATASTGAAVNAKPTDAQTALSGSKEFNSLNLVGTVGVTLGTGSLLTLDSGGMIASTSGSMTGGTLRGSPSGELVVNTVQTFTIGSTIANNGGPTALVKTGSATLYLSTSANTYTGDTYVDAGVLKALALSSSGSSIYVEGGAILQANYIRAHKLSLAPGAKVVLGSPTGLGAGSDFADSGIADSGIGSDAGSPLMDSYVAAPTNVDTAVVSLSDSYIAEPASLSAAATPEPASVLLLVTGIVVLLAWRVAPHGARRGTSLVEGRGTEVQKSSPGSVLRPRPSAIVSSPFVSLIGGGRGPQ